MLDTVKRTISNYMMLENGGNVLVALSGGADSTALLLSLRGHFTSTTVCAVQSPTGTKPSAAGCVRSSAWN